MEVVVKWVNNCRLCMHIGYTFEEQTLDIILLFMIVDTTVQKGCKNSSYETNG